MQCRAPKLRSLVLTLRSRGQRPMVLTGFPASSISSARLPSSKWNQWQLGACSGFESPQLVTAARPRRIYTAFPKQLLPTIRKSCLQLWNYHNPSRRTEFSDFCFGGICAIFTSSSVDQPCRFAVDSTLRSFEKTHYGEPCEIDRLFVCHFDRIDSDIDTCFTRFICRARGPRDAKRGAVQRHARRKKFRSAGVSRHGKIASRQS